MHVQQWCIQCTHYLSWCLYAVFAAQFLVTTGTFLTKYIQIFNLYNLVLISAFTTSVDVILIPFIFLHSLPSLPSPPLPSPPLPSPLIAPGTNISIGQSLFNAANERNLLSNVRGILSGIGGESNISHSECLGSSCIVFGSCAHLVKSMFVVSKLVCKLQKEHSAKKCKNQSCRDALIPQNTAPKTNETSDNVHRKGMHRLHTSQHNAFTA